MSSLPPLISSGVFHVSATSIIDAPIERVWNVLLDFPAYDEWNPFARSQIITDVSGKALSHQLDAVKPGSYLSIKTNMPATMEQTSSQQSTRCLITVVDHDSHRVAWGYDGLPSWLLWTDRWQTLSVVNGKVKYESREVFGGILAYFVMLLYKQKLQFSFNATGEALKMRAEQT